MKKLFITIMAIACCAASQVSLAQSCCKKPTGNSMQMLALNKEFKASHEAPIPFDYAPDAGKMVEYPIPGDKSANAFFVPSPQPTDKVLFIFHEWWGLNDYIRREAENWQKLLGGNVDVYAIDLYDGKVARTADEAGKLMGGLDAKRAQAIIKAVQVKTGNKKIATLGWCMGGSWSFTSSVMAGTQAAGCVMYYGFPEKDASRIKPLRCDVLYIRANQDGFIQMNDVEAFEKVVKRTGQKFTLHSFDAVHAFANPSNPKFDVKAAAEAQVLSVRFLKEKLNIR